MCSIQGPPPRKPIPQPMPIDQPYPFYLDHNATTPLGDEAWDAMCRSRVAWGNPSSLHPYGLEAKYHLDLARETVQTSLGAKEPNCVIFTGSGTEANNLALIGGFSAMRKRDKNKNVILSTMYEHPAIEEVLQMFERGGFSEEEESEQQSEQEQEQEQQVKVIVVRVAIDPKTGVIDKTDFTEKVKKHVEHLAIVSIMHANNELGSINPISELVKIVRDAEAHAKTAIKTPCLFHTDSAQSIGKIEVNINKLGVDMLSVCAHKFYGPKGCGALVVRDVRTCTPLPVLRGAKHERGVRPSTENVLLVSATAAALKSAVENLQQNAQHARSCRDLLYSELKRRLVDENHFEIYENGSVDCALPNTLNVAIFHTPSKLFISAARMITSLGRQIAMSSGSACHAAEDGVVLPVSTPLVAVGCDLQRAIGTLRLSTGKLTQLKDIPRIAQILAHACKQQMPHDS